ncbi:major pollen allergen Ole e 10-like [Andrographis paniculata]|uniref:major pollen allergen Ole e 10-like n=1 Tax=Andrographis paniculata TaxID=175694 RepID=UPI0021E7A98E|nr:major pollen allergen Ole e 10-like [Andrographis paniculata]
MSPVRAILMVAAAAVAVMAGSVNGHDHPDHHAVSGKKWCVPRDDATDVALMGIMAFVCNWKPDCCTGVLPGGDCYQPGQIVKAHLTIREHAAYVMNNYFQSRGGKDSDCGFSGFGMITDVDPSTPTCKFPEA